MLTEWLIFGVACLIGVIWLGIVEWLARRAWPRDEVRSDGD